jgi:hypothetical protein
VPVVTIFGGSQMTEGEADYETGRLLGRELAAAGYTVCNGGYGGVMEATARGAKEGKGKTVGVTTEDFEGPANQWIDREIKMKKWNERLFKLIELGDAYVLLDGGTGTLVELFVVWEMTNKQFLSKPVLIFGTRLGGLVQAVRKIPQVVDNPRFEFPKSARDVVNILDRALGTK